MKIIFLISHLCGGGAEAQLTGLFKYLRSHFHVSVLYFYGPSNLSLKNGIVFYKINISNNYDLQMILKILKIIKYVNPQLIFSSGLQMDLMALICSKICKIPWISRYPSDPLTLPQNPLKKYFHLNILKKCTKIICNSINSKILLSRNISSKKIYFIRNYFDSQKINIKNFKNTTCSKKILCVARLINSKNIRQAMDLVSLISGRKQLLIVGSGPEKRKLRMYKERKKYRFVKFIQFCNAKKLKQIYNQNSIFISLSSSESFPNAVFEAYLNNLKLILSDIPIHKTEFQTPNKILIDCNKSFNVSKINRFVNQKYIKTNKIIETKSSASIKIIGDKYIQAMLGLLNSEQTAIVNNIK